ncbi:MAG: AI-2E family transporter [SAR324 cluster bacterium]|nr:AI-2E family transporter [SAR324 cluster bacterium]
MQEDPNHANAVFLFGYLVLIGLILLMAWPFLTSIIFALILAGVFHPLKTIFEDKTNSPAMASAGICLLIVVSIFVPLVFLVSKLSQESYSLYQYLLADLTEERLQALIFQSEYGQTIINKIFDITGTQLNLTSLKELIIDAAKAGSSYLLETLNAWIANIFIFLLHFFIMLVVIFAVLANDKKIKRFLLDFSPLPDEEEEMMIEKFNQMNYVTLVGNGFGGLIQGMLAGAAFFLAGIESYMLWSTVMIILAFIPLLGISIIYIPACLYLLAIGEIGASIIVFIYCTAVSLIVENWFKPRFVGKRVKIDSTLVFLSIVGGMSVFGIAGIFYGPLIVSVFLTFVSLYHKKYTKLDY